MHGMSYTVRRPMDSIGIVHPRQVLQCGPGPTGASMKAEKPGEMEEWRSFDPRSCPVFYHLHLIPS